MGVFLYGKIKTVAEKNNVNQILVVDDSRVIRRAAVKILEKEFNVIEAEDGAVAWAEMQKNSGISVVFSDLGMPNMDGFELLEHIRNSDDTVLAKMPVVIITGAEESDGTKEKVLALGATDFISKPFDSISLKSRAATHINYRNEVKGLEKNIARDKLTGLLTGSAFNQQCEQQLAYAKRHNTEVTLVRFDIDRFSEVFLKQGKVMAEHILEKVASFITEGKRTEDVAARLGVARFGLLLVHSDMQGAQTVVERICKQVSRLRLKTSQDMFNIQFSTGITSPGQAGMAISFQNLMKQAESALENAVKGGGGGTVLYQEKLPEATPDSTRLNAPEVAMPGDINLQLLLDTLLKNNQQVSEEQLAGAMIKM
ncbi:hypothetical protein MNBD_GAMMA10-2473, partial [hydrothermal vent metagenome]